MGFQRLEEIRAWQFARQFKREVYRLVASSPSASRDFRYRDQLFDAASAVESDIGEGFERFNNSYFVQFLDYALASLREATLRVEDGAARGYFSVAACQRTLELGQACGSATLNLKHSIERFLPGQPRCKPLRRPPRRKRSPKSPGGPKSPDSY